MHLICLIINLFNNLIFIFGSLLKILKPINIILPKVLNIVGIKFPFIKVFQWIRKKWYEGFRINNNIFLKNALSSPWNIWTNIDERIKISMSNFISLRLKQWKFCILNIFGVYKLVCYELLLNKWIFSAKFFEVGKINDITGIDINFFKNRQVIFL